MDLQLSGKRALVTGSSSGIGEAIAERLASEGASVVVHGRSRERAEGVAERINGAGGRAVVAIGDLSDDSEADALVAAALGAFGGLEIVVNNAGGIEPTDWEHASPGAWAEIYNRNVISMVRVIRGTLEAVKAGGWGRFIQIGSCVGAAPFAGVPDYSVTKAANANMSVSLSKALAGTGVTANTVSPGPIRTPGAEAMFMSFASSSGIPGETFEEIERPLIEAMFGSIPAERVGLPREVADAVAFLASPLAGYINGADLRIDGGYVGAVN